MIDDVVRAWAASYDDEGRKFRGGSLGAWASWSGEAGVLSAGTNVVGPYLTNAARRAAGAGRPSYVVLAPLKTAEKETDRAEVH